MTSFNLPILQKNN